jgi:DNA-3-methyladenine glycosylase
MDLLGKILVHSYKGYQLKGRIIETEAYLGKIDAASHAAREHPPSEFFQPSGTIYVYLIYGIHHCLNIIAAKPQKRGAVLIRALTPLKNVEIMQQLRNKSRKNPVKYKNLTNGPGKLCKAFAIDKRLSGKKITQPPLLIHNAPSPQKESIKKTKRIGISKNQEKLLRFFLNN